MQPAEAKIDPQTAVRDYLRAFEARDLGRCTAFYADDAVVQFQLSRYGGRAAIASWHRERFDANLQVLRVEEVIVEDGAVIVDAVVASDRLRKWKFDSLSVRLTLEFQDGRIRELKCDIRATPW
jgi:hypothetical protein